MSSESRTVPPYPLRHWREPAADRWVRDRLGSVVGALRRHVRDDDAFVASVDAHGASLEAMDEQGLQDWIDRLRLDLRRASTREAVLPSAFAIVREVARRRIGQRHYDVQLVGGRILLEGKVAEMETGEGKTLTATLAASVAALSGRPVHVVTVNDYLAERDASEMGPIYRGLGLTVGLIRQGMTAEERRRQYAADITYCSNKELAFDYLKDRLALGNTVSRAHLAIRALREGGDPGGRLLLRGLVFAIVDEADSVLVDEARVPLIIARESAVEEQQALYRWALGVARGFEEGRHFVRIEPTAALELTEAGRAGIEAARAQPGVSEFSHRYLRELVTKGLMALHSYRLGRDYIVKDGKIVIVDQFTGRAMPDRSWQGGVHQLVELKEGCELTVEKSVSARTSYQRFFRRYLQLSGMTGTASEIAGELWRTYRLPVVRVPTHRPLRRRAEPSRGFTTQVQKLEALCDRVAGLHASGRPVLIGTPSVEASERLSSALERRGVEHQVLNARQDQAEAEIIARAGAPGTVTIATNMAGRGTDIRIPSAVAELGGLHVIATERHEARRIDRQLAGRCGRQGDPGTHELYFALDDEVPRAFLPETLRAAIQRWAANDRPGSAALCALACALAQRRAEAYYARVRRGLLVDDEQLDDLLAFSGRTTD